MWGGGRKWWVTNDVLWVIIRGRWQEIRYKLSTTYQRVMSHPDVGHLFKVDFSMQVSVQSKSECWTAHFNFFILEGYNLSVSVGYGLIVLTVYDDVMVIVVRQQPPHPRRLTSFIELFHAANFGPSTACGQVPFTFPATAVILGSSILLLSTVDPLARAGMETPTGVRCLAKPATNTSPSTPSFVSLTFL